MRVFTKLFAYAIIALMPLSAIAQAPLNPQQAIGHIKSNFEKWNLTESDVADLHLQDAYVSDHNGATHYYFIQRVNGIEIYNAIINVTISKNGKPVFTGNRLVANAADKINTRQGTISAIEAVTQASQRLGAPAAKANLKVKEQLNANHFIFEKGNISNSDIPVKLCYQKKGGRLVLAWNTAIDMVENDDYWSVRVDAQTGEIISKNNYTVYCKFEAGSFARHSDGCTGHHNINAAAPAAAMTGGSYRVFALPLESPNHGPQTLEVEPALPAASPYGWHDVNGEDGAEYTITRGNNVHAYLDLDNSDVSKNDEPDGGTDLIFDFPYDPLAEPADMREAAVTNLFYMNNMIHDFTYAYGFNEAAGNFQTNNYGNGGQQGDYVIAQAQDGGGTNNANFATPADGGNGRMQMYLWSSSSGTFRIDAPAEIEGWIETGAAQFGPPIDENTNITSTIVEVDDDIRNPYDTDACEAIANAAEIAGNIALVDRGGCFFVEKTLFAEEAGAIAVVICNFEEGTIGMSSPAGFDQPTIPTVMIGSGDCASIRQYIGQEVVGTMKQQEVTGPSSIDGDFDNGIIAHEYGHGISNRLTGGPSAAGCLNNEEQMGEGWSDFFTLVTTVHQGDEGASPRGVGTFAQRQSPGGRGIRPYPYSTDLSVNPVTYRYISQLSIPHGLGSVWCSMLWDMYWAFVDEYGFDEDLINGTGGNNMAVQLVMDGMKLQACNPGFVDGRDAILAADEILYDGANQCLIWKVFARRGLGYFADQGDANNSADGIESFEPLPICVKELKITKNSTPLIQAGEEITTEIKLINHKEGAVTDVVVSDELPSGLTFIGLESATGIDISEVTVDTDVPGVVSFGVGTMNTDDEITLTYRAISSPDNYSVRLYFDDIPDNSINTENRWLINFTSDGDVSNNLWHITDADAYSGDYSWNVDDDPDETRQILEQAFPVTISGTQPVLRFYHKINSYPGHHGGVVEVAEGNDLIFKTLDSEIFRNDYTGYIDYEAFTVPNLRAFSGTSDGFEATYVDLSDFNGLDVRFRFRFGTDEIVDFKNDYIDYFGSLDGGEGWYVDDFEIMDMFNYDGEACVTSAEGDNACDKSPERGTIVETNSTSAVQEVDAGTQFSVYPNPASAVVHLSIDSEITQRPTVRLMSASGQLLRQEQIQVFEGTQLMTMKVGDLPKGLYFVRIETEKGTATEKIFIQ